MVKNKKFQCPSNREFPEFFNEDWGFWSYLTLLEMIFIKEITQGVEQELNGMSFIEN